SPIPTAIALRQWGCAPPCSVHGSIIVPCGQAWPSSPPPQRSLRPPWPNPSAPPKQPSTIGTNKKRWQHEKLDSFATENDQSRTLARIRVNGPVATIDGDCLHCIRAHGEGENEQGRCKQKIRCGDGANCTFIVKK